METGESSWAAAMREAREEACAEIEIDALIAVYDIPRISQVQLMHRARLVSHEIAPGVESLEVGLFCWADIPWDDLAFPSVHWTLKQWRAVRDQVAVVPARSPEFG
jgi:ADP-ribose pyrophosphatase YjhB (NUDIX family)